MRYLQMDSGVSVEFIGENGLKLLALNKHIVADGTFDLIKNKLILTTLMVYHQDIAIPATYLVSDLRTKAVPHLSGNSLSLSLLFSLLILKYRKCKNSLMVE
jgi:hypothetical protein